MRKTLLLLLLVACVGCVSVQMPRYIEDKFSYKKQFYASLEDTQTAAKKALAESGWKIAETADPATYEHDENYDASKGKQVLLFTEPRQTSMFLFSRYTNLNVYIRTLEADSTEVEIRYFSMLPAMKSFKSSKNDHLADKLFNLIAEDLKK